MNWRENLEFTRIVAVAALVVSALSYYRSYLYTKQQLDVTVTEVSYVTNQGALYMRIAFANAGNRDGALLRVEPALWSRVKGKSDPEWVPLGEKVDPAIPLVAPNMPMVVKAGGIEVVTLSTMLESSDARDAVVASQGGAFLGLRVASMNADGNLYLLEHPVARLTLDKTGRIQAAEPAIHQTLSAFEDTQAAPPGDHLQANKKTPFVWAERQY
jgi:hypothetical protein